MNAIMPIIAETPLPNGIDWKRARADSATWRARHINWHARAELAVSEALLRLAEAGLIRSVEHLTSCRFDQLRNLLDTDARLVTHASISPTLISFRKHFELRNFLCHGAATLLISESGCWHLLLVMVETRRGQCERRLLSVDETEAKEKMRVLQSDVDRLTRSLHNMCNAL